MPVAPAPESRGQRKRIGTAAPTWWLALVSATFSVTLPVTAAELGPWQGGAKPRMTLDLLGGGGVSLPPTSQDAGEGPVIVHFFATWCPPCVPELAALDRLAADRTDLTVIAIDVGEVDARVSRFLRTHDVGFPVAMDRDLAGARAWGVTGLPASFVFTGAKAPALAADGDVAWDGETARGLLDALKDKTGRPDT